jgi:hypothetical protein
LTAPLSVLFVVGDALRDDALAMRHDGRPTPFTERIESWVRFDRCYTTAPWTLPAVRGLFCGIESTEDRLARARGDEPVPSLIGRFDRLQRAAVVNNGVLRSPQELGEGFDDYRWVKGFTETFAEARRFLSERSSDHVPYFLYVHSNMVHDYYKESARTQFERWFPSTPFPDIGRRVLTWSGLEKKRDVVRMVYDACALQFNEELETLVGATDLDRTIVVVMADHGEGFDPALARVHHGGRVHDDLLRIPCVIHLPEGAGPALHDRLAAAAARPFSAVDLLPLLLVLSGHGHAPSPAGSAPAPAPRRRRVLRAEDPKYLCLGNGLRLNSNLHGKHMTFGVRLSNRLWQATLGKTTLVQAFVDWPYKLIATRMEATSGLLARLGRPWQRRAHRGRPAAVVRGRFWFGFELYDLERDPGETTNLLPRRREVAERGVALVERLERGHDEVSVTSLVDGD